MSYPPYLARITHFQFDATAGVSDYPLPSGVDSELDAIHASVNQQNAVIRRITTADGRLRNVAAALAMSLAGFDEVTATADGQTDFVTDIDWDSTFSTGSVLAFIAGERIDVTSVQDDGSGFLELTIAAQDDGTEVTIYAFSGQPVSYAAVDVTIADAGGYTAQTNVETAIQELYSRTQGASGKTWLEGVLVMSDYLLKAGGTMTGNIAMSSGATITGLPASAANGHAVRHEQVVALQTSITGITATFMPKSGGTFTGAVDFNNQTVEGVPTPTASDHAASKGYVDTTLASFGGLPVGTMIDFGGSSVPTGWLACDGSAVSRSTYASLFAVIGTTWGPGDASTTFNLPDLRGRSSLGSGTGSGLTARSLAATGGEETHTILEAELPTHYHFVAANATHAASGANKVTATETVAWSGTGSADEAYQLVKPSVATPATLGRSSEVGSGTAINVMHPFAVVTKIIKY